jgi:hypothetical protein
LPALKNQKNSKHYLPLNSLVAGTDKWHIENMIDGDFFWMGHPFDNSRARGFIEPFTELNVVFPIPVLVDLEECGNIDLLGFNHDNCIFFCEKWIQTASKVASLIKNITFFTDDRQFTIKRDFIILGREEK